MYYFKMPELENCAMLSKWGSHQALIITQLGSYLIDTIIAVSQIIKCLTIIYATKKNGAEPDYMQQNVTPDQSLH